MRIAIVAPSSSPFVVGGAENLWWGMLRYLNDETDHQADLIKLPVRETSLVSLVNAYRAFSQLDLSGFDWVISTKYPAWMISHPNHVVYMQHTCRGFYDWYPVRELGGIDYRGENPVVREFVTWMRIHAGSRDALPEFFARFDALCAAHPRETDQHPSPLGRVIIHFLDGVGLAPKYVKRHLAIAEAVKRREGYFPRGAKVEVVYHPSNKTGFANHGEEYFFTASRFYPSKRIDMLIRAYRQTSLPHPFKIAGTGDEADKLKALAGDDKRFEFLGFVRDDELVDLYSRAIAVPFIPEDEDFGYITLEAMLCEKPVITTRDSGGPLELVTHGYTGLVCDPTEKSLAAAFAQVCDHREWARHQGVVAKARADQITWPSLFDVLLSTRTTSVIKPSTRPKITVLNPFAVWPANSGGRYRVLSLYRALASHVDVDLVTLGLPHEGDAVNEICEGLRELSIARSPAHFAADQEWHTKMGMPVYDITSLDHIHLTPDYLTMLRASLKGSVLAVVSHPYMLTALKQVGYTGQWVHEAHNHEAVLKQGMLKDTPFKAELTQRVLEAERECCQKSALVFATCQTDADSLMASYSVPAEAMLVVPNGTDTRGIRFAKRGVRARLKRRLKLPDQPIALFLASGHRPNLISAEALFKIAPEVPHIAFALVGNLADAYENWPLPSNIWRIGSVSEEARNVWLEIADIALNPTLFGGGTNLKLLDYFAAGVPVISTEIGVRGIEAKHGEHLIVAEMDELVSALNSLPGRADEVDQWVHNARQLVEREYDWRVIAQRLYDALLARGLVGKSVEAVSA